MLKTTTPRLIILSLAVVALAACAKRETPVPVATQPPPGVGATSADANTGSTTPRRVDDPLPVPPQPALVDDSVSNVPLDVLNKNSPLRPVFFTVDSAELDDEARATAAANAEILKQNQNWIITVEGHCDERGTAEYNLALGERRAIAVKTFLVSLGISPDRIRTISYGKEFPFDPARTEEAFAKNRRGHFVITSN